MNIQSTITKALYNYEPNGERSLCPECSSDRKHPSEKCLAWDKEKNRGYCHNCHAAFYEYHPKKEYICPPWANKTDLTDQAVRYFESRMISQRTLMEMKVYSDVRFMSDPEERVEVICFPYFADGTQINIKSRGLEKKCFQLEKGAELIFWNIDCLKEFDEVVIVEGEIDALTMIQAGFKNTMSVPNGAAKNLEYLHLEMFEKIKKIYIAVDQDEPGIALKDELIKKLGAERCYIVSFRDCKDANEYLQKYTDEIKDVLLTAYREESDYEKLKAKLYIDPTIEIGEPPVYCFIDGKPAMTKGSFSMIDGKKKHGKTFAVGAIVAAMLSNSLQIGKVKGNLPTQKNKILYFDTEQSPYHAARSVRRICRLAKNDDPINLLAFGLRPLTPAERLSFIERTIKETEALAVVVVDGIRDLLTNGINDEPEATSLTSKFLNWTENYDMHMILLLHQNKNDLNARGHIGTEMGNKSETIISVTKDKKNNIFTVACDDSKDKGFDEFAFTIDENGMIESSELPNDEQSKTKNPHRINEQKHFEVLDHIFQKNEKLSYSELQTAIINGFDNSFGETASRAFVFHYTDKNWIKKIRDVHKVFYTYSRAAF